MYELLELIILYLLDTYVCLPTRAGNTALGASSPANPALHIPDPLSITRAATSSGTEAILVFLQCMGVLRQGGRKEGRNERRKEGREGGREEEKKEGH
jgi:hypothetical protein